MSKDTDRNYAHFYADHTDVPAEVNLDIVPAVYPRRWLVRDILLRPERPEDYDDLGKLSGACGYFFSGGRIDAQGLTKEDAIDLNNESNRNAFVGVEITCGRKLAVTCKGGSSDNLWDDCLIRGRGKVVEFEFGDHSDQSKKKATGNVLRYVRHEDGKPVRIAWGCHANKPRIEGGNVKVVWWWVVALHIHTFIKSLFA